MYVPCKVASLKSYTDITGVVPAGVNVILVTSINSLLSLKLTIVPSVSVDTAVELPLSFFCLLSNLAVIDSNKYKSPGADLLAYTDMRTYLKFVANVLYELIGVLHDTPSVLVSIDILITGAPDTADPAIETVIELFASMVP